MRIGRIAHHWAIGFGNSRATSRCHSSSRTAVLWRKTSIIHCPWYQLPSGYATERAPCSTARQSQPISHTPHCMNQLHRRAVIDLPPEIANIHVDNIHIAVETIIPGVLDDHLTGNDAFGVSEQIFQDSKLLIGEV